MLNFMDFHIIFEEKYEVLIINVLKKSHCAKQWDTKTSVSPRE